MNQQEAPLFEALLRRRMKGEASFHVPGHKFGALLKPEEAEIFGPVAGIDYTEIDGLDDLHHPEGVILAAQRLAADCFGAEESFFLVNGSTVGNLALLTAVCARGDRILVQRNVHKSVLHGLMIAGAEAVFLEPITDPDTGLAASINLDTLKYALRIYPEAKAVFLSNPNYYGMGMDLAAYAEAAHAAGMPLLVDEAHGAHFGLHPGVPASALSRGADAVVQSTHKMLTAMTMGAMLHVQGPRLNRPILKQRLAMLQSSSPSYPLMAALDLARRTAVTEGKARLEENLRELEAIRTQAEGWHNLQLVKRNNRSPYDELDPFKLTFYDRKGRMTGFELQKHLTGSGIVPEMADERHVVLACSLANGRMDFQRLSHMLDLTDLHLGALTCDPADAPQPTEYHIQRELGWAVGDPVAFDLDAKGRMETETVPLEEAAGERSAETVIPYPPGIPILYPGERIRPEVILRIRLLVQAGARFQGGLQDPSGYSILIIKRNGES